MLFRGENLELNLIQKMQETPPTHKGENYDPIQNCKYLLPCGWCEKKNEICKGEKCNLNDILNEFLDGFDKRFCDYYVNIFSTERRNGWNECMEMLRKYADKMVKE